MRMPMRCMRPRFKISVSVGARGTSACKAYHPTSWLHNLIDFHYKVFREMITSIATISVSLFTHANKTSRRHG